MSKHFRGKARITNSLTMHAGCVCVTYLQVVVRLRRVRDTGVPTLRPDW